MKINLNLSNSSVFQKVSPSSICKKITNLDSLKIAEGNSENSSESSSFFFSIFNSIWNFLKSIFCCFYKTEKKESTETSSSLGGDKALHFTFDDVLENLDAFFAHIDGRENPEDLDVLSDINQHSTKTGDTLLHLLCKFENDKKGPFYELGHVVTGSDIATAIAWGADPKLMNNAGETPTAKNRETAVLLRRIPTDSQPISDKDLDKDDEIPLNPKIRTSESRTENRGLGKVGRQTDKFRSSSEKLVTSQQEKDLSPILENISQFFAMIDPTVKVVPNSDINFQHPVTKQTLLHLLCIYENETKGPFYEKFGFMVTSEHIKNVLKSIANVEIVDEDGNLPLHLIKSAQTAQYLIDFGRPFHGIVSGDGKTFVFTHQYWPALDQVNKKGLSPLYNAFNTRQFDLGKFLILQGAKTNIKNAEKLPLIHFCVQQDLNPEIIIFLIEKDVNFNPNAKDVKGTSILQLVLEKAIELVFDSPKALLDIASKLISEGADTSIRINGKSIFELEGSTPSQRSALSKFINDLKQRQSINNNFST